MKSICLFCSYFTSDNIPNYVQFYVKELTKHFTKVVFITNEKELNSTSVSFLETNRIELFFVSNEGHDFGMWYKAMLKYDIEQYDRVGLINDSCILFKPLDDYFTWLNKQDLDFAGMTDSDEITYHIQSYFLTINKRAIEPTLQFFKRHGLQSDREEVIKIYELGLCKKLQESGLKAAGWFAAKKYMPKYNPSLYAANKMIEDGFPLIKKKIIFNSFTIDEYREIAKHKFNHNPKYYISLIQNNTKSNNNAFNLELLASDGYKLSYGKIINHMASNFFIKQKSRLIWCLKAVYKLMKIRFLRDVLEYSYQKIKNKFSAPVNPDDLKIAICLMCKDENTYLDEWLGHHESLGFDHFFIYDNNSVTPIAETLKGRNNCTVVLWKDNVLGKQMRAYLDCCKKNTGYDWILFIDTDEFLMLKKHKTVKEFIANYNKFSAVGLNWICYTSSGFENRVEWNKYSKFISLDNEINRHIKSFVNPKLVKYMPLDPHKFPVITVDEQKGRIKGPFSSHSSDIAYIRHNVTRSKNEYLDKIKRGMGCGAPNAYSLDAFYQIDGLATQTEK